MRGLVKLGAQARVGRNKKETATEKRGKSSRRCGGLSLARTA